MRPRSNRARRTSCAWSGTRSASSENSYSEEAERVPDQAQLVRRALLERGLIGTPEAEQAALALVGHLNDETSGGLVLGYDGRVNPDRKSTRLNSSHSLTSRMPSSA